MYLVPMNVIRRPLPSELDEDKVQTFMAEMKVSHPFSCIRISLVSIADLFLRLSDGQGSIAHRIGGRYIHPY